MHICITIYHNNLKAIDDFSLSNLEMKVNLPSLFILATSLHCHLFQSILFFSLKFKKKRGGGGGGQTQVKKDTQNKPNKSKEFTVA